uniref:serine C-palmitoyltransferase n=1 Tax=Myxobolus squamalis TaxID=59785 RepID=A0A6B2G3N9_MYXSQ
MMGTFTKSFGSCGGYISADKKIIDFLRKKSYCTNYGSSMSPPACAQIIASINIMTGKIGDGMGQTKLQTLRENIVYFRRHLKKMGFIIYGHDTSPVVPILIYIPGKLGAFSRIMLEHNVAVVVVGFPATSILSSRARFCISSSHTKEMLDYVLKTIDLVGSKVGIKYNN